MPEDKSRDQLIEKVDALQSAVIEIRISLARMEANLESSKDQRDVIASRIKELEDDMVVLQKRINYAAGGIAVVVSVLSIAWQIVSKNIG